MNIAIIGWGSLIWDPKTLQIVNQKWNPDGPKLPIEFARISGGERVTLVIYPTAQLKQTLWNKSILTDLDEAREDLRVREGSFINDIHFVEKAKQIKTDDKIKKRILKWLNSQNDIDAAIWTGLESNWPDKTGTKFSIKNVICYLRHLPSNKMESAKKYIIKAPAQINTRVRKSIENDLGWK